MLLRAAIEMITNGTGMPRERQKSYFRIAEGNHGNTALKRLKRSCTRDTMCTSHTVTVTLAHNMTTHGSTRGGA